MVRKIPGIFICLLISLMLQGNTAALPQYGNGYEESDNPVISDTANKIQGKITFTAAYSYIVDTVFKDLVEEFKKKNPGTEVEVQGMDNPQKIYIMLAANDMTDIMPVPYELDNSDYSSVFESIDDLGFTKDNIYFFKKGLGSDGKLYSLCSQVNFNGIVYNKAAFKRAGIKKVPTTEAEFYSVCGKLKAKGIIPMVSGYKDIWPLTWYTSLYPKMNLADPNYLNKLAEKNTPLSNDKGLLAGFKFLKGLKDKGYIEKNVKNAGWDDMIKNFATGKAAMAFTGNWFTVTAVENGVKAENIGMFPVPGLKSILVEDGWYYAVSKSSHNKETAKAFMKFLWEDSRYCKKAGTTSPLKVKKYEDKAVSELLSFKKPVIENIRENQQFNEMLSGTKNDWNKVLQEYLLSKKPDSVVKKYNKEWAAARKNRR